MKERSKFAKQFGGLRGVGGRGVPSHNVGLCTVFSSPILAYYLQFKYYFSFLNLKLELYTTAALLLFV